MLNILEEKWPEILDFFKNEYGIQDIAFGTFMYIVVFEILKSKYLIDYIYQGININFSWISIILTFILVLLLVIILNNRKIHKLLVKSINNIIGSI